MSYEIIGICPYCKDEIALNYTFVHNGEIYTGCCEEIIEKNVA